MDLEELILENKRLKEENIKLKLLLKNNNICFNDLPLINFSTKDKIKIYMDYFKGRTDVYAEKYVQKDGKKGYAKVCKNRFSILCDFKKYKQCKECPNETYIPLDENAYFKHLQGKTSLGIYPIVECKYTFFLAIDFDGEKFKEAALAYKKECNKIGIDAIIELSRSGEGAHVWLFFSDKIEAKKARTLGDYLLSQAMINNKSISFKSYDRFFPTQDFIDEFGYGNCIALPLQGECVKNKKTSMFVDDLFIPFENQINELKSIRKISGFELDVIFKTYNLSENPIEFNSKNLKKCNLLKSDFKDEVEIIIKDDIYINKKGLSDKALGYIKRLGVIINPEFYEKQAKRLSTYNIERVIELYREDVNYVSLPRGCIDDLIMLFNYIGVHYEIKDFRVNLDNIDISLKATLRPEQKEMVETLLKYDNGLLVAKTGSGKTVMGMSVIFYIQKPTLILVEKVKLLEQWKEKIKDFMNFEPGVYYGAKRKLTGIIDIASIKSLDEDSTLYDKYDTIVGDEIHHIASATYENVIRRFNARHIYGFTATPYRSDHLEKIIYKCIAPIRCTLKEKESSFSKILMPRFTKFKYQKEYEMLSYPDLCNKLYKDNIRNEQIINDIIVEYNNDKRILVLTERNEHIDILFELLKDKCKNIFKINGSAKTSEKKVFINSINGLNDNFIIISTGKYLGEGFDMPNLDTLFLAMPFKWKGLLSQYIGRIQREVEGKKQVVVYDYVDIKCGKFSHQFQMRLKEYKKEGYVVLKDNEKINLLFSYNSYKKQLISDIESANEVKFMFNYYNDNVLNELYGFNDNILLVTDCIVDGNFKIKKYHSDLNIILIDDRIIWYGSINPLTYPSKEGTILRLDDEEYVKELINQK